MGTNQFAVPSRYAILDNEEGSRFFSGAVSSTTARVAMTIIPQEVNARFHTTSSLCSPHSPPPYITYHDLTERKQAR